MILYYKIKLFKNTFFIKIFISYVKINLKKDKSSQVYIKIYFEFL